MKGESGKERARRRPTDVAGRRRQRGKCTQPIERFSTALRKREKAASHRLIKSLDLRSLVTQSHSRSVDLATLKNGMQLARIWARASINHGWLTTRFRIQGERRRRERVEYWSGRAGEIERWILVVIIIISSSPFPSRRGLPDGKICSVM